MTARKDRRHLSFHFCSVNGIVEAARNPELRAALAHASVAAPDGMPLVWLGWIARQRVQRVCGPDFMPALLERGRAIGYRHFFYGGAGGVAERLRQRMTERFPGVRVVGAETPPFAPLTGAENDAAIERINAADPDCVWLGVSTPKQDIWLHENRAHIHAPVVLAVGAAFDFLSGSRARAPRWMQRSGLEWSFRLLAEPRRLGRRYTVTNLRFVGLLFRDALARRSKTAG
ncbi:MAG: WecB/TagA/CpsF family glycosyltransferase [Chloroflexota bacterium]|nr:WecB/TagA/CpsF family glycosyltransferase [Chloroflexota bacterium]